MRRRRTAAATGADFWYNLENLRYQFEWRGPRLMNIRLRVCRKCTDVPFIFYKPIVVPPDPVPVRDPRLDNFGYYNGPPGEGAVAGSGGSNPLPPLPWPQTPIGPVDPNAPAPPTFELPQPPPPDIPQLEELEGEP